MGKPVTSEDISIDVPYDEEDDDRVMFKKPERAWFGQLGYINVTEMSVNLVTDAKPFKSPQFHAGPKIRELELAKIDKQLK